MDYTIILVIGDWSHGGHGKSSIATIRSNLSKEEMELAYQKGIRQVGISFIEEIGAEYDDDLGCVIAEEQQSALDEAGIDTSCIKDGRMCEECFVEIYLALVELGNPEFHWGRIGHEENHIRIGGYGLF